MKQLKYSVAGILALTLMYCTPKVGDQVTTGPKPDTKVPAMTTDFRSKAPEAGPARKIEIGKYETFTLDNGLRVIVVENHKIPRISYRLFVDRDPIVEGDIAGMTGIAGDLLSKGTTTRTKAQIDESVDFVGASLNTNAQGGFASSLTNHSETVLSIFADVILHPSFPEAEFEKLKKQTISGLQANKDDPNAIAGNVSSALVYGKDHPYGEIMTEVTVSNISLDDCRNYYDTYFKPNISYLVVVGDVAPALAKERAEKYFGQWKRGDVKELTYDTPTPPEHTQVDFVDKAGAVQSVINISYPVDLKPGSPDVIPSRVMNTILGSGFSGRLFKNLREDKAYTYGAYSSLSSDELVGEFSASASVRNVVTDSAVTQFLYELNRMRSEPVTPTELELAKNYIAGAFARSLESPQTVASFALNTYRYGLPKDYYATYLEQLEKVSVDDVMAMAKKYVDPDHAYIVVVGNQDEVSGKLAPFDKDDGKISFYDIYANEKAAPSAAAVDVSGQDVIKAYLKAIGGEDKLESVSTLSVESNMPIQGMGEATILMQHQAPDQFAMTMSMGGNVMQRQVFDGEKGYMEAMGQKQMLEGDMLEEIRKEAIIFPETTYLSDDYSLEVKGTEEIDGEPAYKLLVKGPSGNTTEYYSTSTGYKVRTITSQEANGQTMTITTEFKDYREVNGIYIPYVQRVTGAAPFPLEMTATKVEVNSTLDPGIFQVN